MSFGSSNKYGFYQYAQNVSKMGYYPTDNSHCEMISRHLKFKEGEKTYCLDPGIGDGNMLITVTNADDGTSEKCLFGVEVNQQRADEASAKPQIDTVLCADFPADFRCSHGVFQLIAANPAYLDEEDESEEGGSTAGSVRYEVKCLEALPSYLAKDGILVWIVSLREFFRLQHTRKFLNRFEVLKLFKFHSSEYSKYHQIVVFAKKRTSGAMIKNSDLEGFYKRFLKAENFQYLFSEEDGGESEKDKTAELLRYLEEDIEVLPEKCCEEERIAVPFAPKSATENFIFTNKEFNVAEALEYLSSLPKGVDEDIAKYQKFMGYGLSQKTYKPMDVGICALPLGKAHACLCATSGVGEGACGVEGEDFHLQRGKVESVKHIYYEERDGKTVCVESMTTNMTMSVLETNGNYMVLK